MRCHRLAVLGCGQEGSNFVAGLAGRLSENFHLDVHLQSADRAKKAEARVVSLCEGLPIRARLRFTDEKVVAADTDLLFIQLPNHPSGVPQSQFIRPDQTLFEFVVERATAQLNPDTIILRYTAAFTETPMFAGTAEEKWKSRNTGLFHFSNPARLLPLVEVGLFNMSDPAQDYIRTCLKAAGYFPLLQRKWEPGFFSVRFQLRLLKAVEEIISAAINPEDASPARIDTTIRLVVEALRTLFIASKGEGKIFEPLEAQFSPLLARTPLYEPLWRAFQETWAELSETLSDCEIATALLGGPALRCIKPGFLRTVDIEGIAPFCSLFERIHPEYDATVLEGLMLKGRIGGPAVGNGGGEPAHGFFDWTAISRQQAMQSRDLFLAENSISLAIG